MDTLKCMSEEELWQVWGQVAIVIEKEKRKPSADNILNFWLADFHRIEQEIDTRMIQEQ